MEFVVYAFILGTLLTASVILLLEIKTIADRILEDLVDRGLYDLALRAERSDDTELNSTARVALHLYKEALRLDSWFRNGFLVVVLMAVSAFIPDQVGKSHCVSENVATLLQCVMIAIAAIWCIVLVYRCSKASRGRSKYLASI